MSCPSTEQHELAFRSEEGGEIVHDEVFDSGWPPVGDHSIGRDDAASMQDVVAHAAHERGADGVVCGHIHSAEIRQIGSVTYYNDGDWVESCTALVEHPDGQMQIVDWAEHKRSVTSVPVTEPIAA